MVVEGRGHAEQVFGVHLRADAYTKAVEILKAADRLLRVRPAATLEEIAQEAGASRATIYRRFPTRSDLIIALSRWAVLRIVAALDDAGIGVVPAGEALRRATSNVLQVKVGLEYARTLPPAEDPLVSEIQQRMSELVMALLRQCRSAGLIDADEDLEWVRTVFYALVHEASTTSTADSSRMAERVITTLLNGVGPRTPVR